MTTEQIDQAVRASAAVAFRRFPGTSLRDLVQIGWVAALQAIRRGDGRDVDHYVKVTVHWATFDAARTHYRRRARERRDPDPPPPGAIIDAGQTDPADAAELRSLGTFEHMIRGLPAAHRQTLRLLYVEGLSGAETGRRLGLDRSTILRRHAAAIELLRGLVASC